MRKRLLIGVIVVVLAVGTIGAAFATGMDFTNVGALSLGYENVPQIDCDYVAFHLKSAMGDPVKVDGVYLSFDTDFSTAAFSVSLRDAGGAELAYCALNSHTQTAATTSCFHLYADGSPLPTPDQVYAVKVTVAENGVYNAAPAGGWVIGPGDPGPS